MHNYFWYESSDSEEDDSQIFYSICGIKFREDF